MFRTSRGTREESPSEQSGGTRQPSVGPSGASPAPAPSPAWGPTPQPSEVAPATGQVAAPADGDQQVAPAGTRVARKRKHTFANSVYAGIAVILIILIVVIDFILQNLHEANIHLFTAEFRLPIGIMVLLGAVGGALAVFLITLFLHLLQLRRERRLRAGKEKPRPVG